MNRPNRFNAAYALSFVGFDFGDRRRICSRKPAQVRFYAGMFILWPALATLGRRRVFSGPA